MSTSAICNGNISPARFVKWDTTKVGGWVLQCGAGDRPAGVSQPGTRQPPMAGLDDGFAGVAGLNAITVFTANDECWLQTGAAVTVGDYLKADSTGRGVTAGTDKDAYGAQCLESGTAADQLVLVRVLIGERGGP